MTELDVVMCTQAVMVCGATERLFKSGARPTGIALYRDGDHVLAQREGFPDATIHNGVLAITVAKPVVKAAAKPESAPGLKGRLGRRG